MYGKNVGAVDRAVRFVIGVALVAVGLFALGGLDGRPFGIVAIVVGAAALVTAATARCPGYVPFGIDTRKACCGHRRHALHT